MSEVSSHKQDDLLTQYGTATTAYLLMAMSIDSLGRKNRQLEAENARLREFATEVWELLTCNEPVFVWKELQDLARKLEIEVEE